jgi:hydroxyethylthiazole kinase-like uncharacterized protein yjeF
MFKDILCDIDVIVDALLGIGLTGQVREAVADLITKTNAAGKPVVAVDIPSGLCSDTGQVLGVAIKADVTVTMVALKQGLFTADAPNHVGQLFYAGVGIGEDFERIAEPRPFTRSERHDFLHYLKPRLSSLCDDTHC